MRHRRLVVDRASELERPLDVFLRGLEVALPAVAPRARLEDLGAEQVRREARPLGELERGVEEPERRRDARKLVAGDAELVDDLGTLDVGDVRALDEPARLLEQRDRFADLALDRHRARLACEHARLELRGARREHGRLRRLVQLERRLALVRAHERLGACERALDTTPLVRRDAVREEAGVAVQPLRQPLDRLGRRAGLAALDLADVLLREPLARELALRQSRGDAELTKALAEAQGCGLRRALLAADGSVHDGVGGVFSILHQSASVPTAVSPKRVMSPRDSGQPRWFEIT